METWKIVIQCIVSAVTVYSFFVSVMYGVGAVMDKNDAKLWRCENIRKQTLEEAKSEKRKAIIWFIVFVILLITCYWLMVEWSV